jgi:hypothetical protein
MYWSTSGAKMTTHAEWAFNEDAICTPIALKELHPAGLYLKVLSNNHSFIMQWLRCLPSIHLVHSSTAIKDMTLALSATAIVQHASQGWSSYTSVPAMALGIPLINTFNGTEHRFDHFRTSVVWVVQNVHNLSIISKFQDFPPYLWTVYNGKCKYIIHYGPLWVSWTDYVRVMAPQFIFESIIYYVFYG